MENKNSLLAMTAGVALLCGLIGGFLGNMLFKTLPSEATFAKVTVTDELIVQAEGDQEKGCRIHSNGSIRASDGLLAMTVRSNQMASQNFMAMVNPTSLDPNQQRICAEFGASAATGGALVIRDAKASFSPAAKNLPQQGDMLYFGYDKGGRALYAHDIAKGEQGHSFILSLTQGQQNVAGQQPGSPTNPQGTAPASATSRSTPQPGTPTNGTASTGMGSGQPPQPGSGMRPPMPTGGSGGSQPDDRFSRSPGESGTTSPLR